MRVTFDTMGRLGNILSHAGETSIHSTRIEDVLEFFTTGVAFLALFIAIISPLGTLFLLAQNANLRRALGELERRTQALESRPASLISPTPPATLSPASSQPQRPEAHTDEPPVATAASTAPQGEGDSTAPEAQSVHATQDEPSSQDEAQDATEDAKPEDAPAEDLGSEADEPAAAARTDTSDSARPAPPPSPDATQDGDDGEQRAPLRGPSPDQTTPAPATPSRPPSSATAEGRKPRPSGGSLEETLGSTVAVWGGAIALALAAAMLVQYGIQNAVLSPAMRVALGGAVSLLMVIGGEVAFRRVRPVGGGLVGAGIVGLYATFGASAALYEMLSPLLAMGLMILTTLTAAFLSIRHKLLIIAVIGLIGGFLTPLLVGVSSDSPMGFLIYLLVLHCGVVAVVHWRCWPSLLMMAAGMTFVAEMGWLLQGPREVSWSFITLAELLMVPGVLASVLGVGLDLRPTARPGHTARDTDDEQTWSERWGAAAAHPWARTNLHAAILPTMVVLATAALWWRYPAGIWWTQVLPGALALGLVVSHRKHLISMPVAACGVLLMQQWVYLIDIEPSHVAAIQVFLNVAVLYVGGFVFIALRRPRQFSAPCAAIIIALIQYLIGLLHAMGHADGEFGWPTALYWGVFTVMLGGGFALSAWGAHRRHLATLDDERAQDADKPAAASRTMSIGAALFLFIAAPVALEGNTLTLAMLTYVAATTASARVTRHDEPAVLGLVALTLVACRLLLPTGAHELTGSLPLINWIALIYVPAIGATLWAGWHLDRTERWSGTSTRCIRLLGLAFFLAWITLEIRHFYHPDWLGQATRAEQLTYSIGWASVGFGALLYGLWRRNAVSRWVSLVLIGGTAFKVFLLDLAFLDGLWRVASLAGLGVVLIALATLYRLYVFPSKDDDEP